MSGLEFADRMLPRDLDAERAVLGAILLSDAAYDAAVRTVAPAEFYRDAHQRIFRAMAALKARQVPVELVTLKDELRTAGDLDEVGGPAYLAALLDGVPKSTNAAAYGQIIREKARLRALAALGNEIVAAAYSADAPAADVARQAASRLDAVWTVDGAVGPTAVGDAVWRYLDRLGRGERVGLPTGYLDVDALTGGLYPGELAIVAARPAVGKSAYALGLAEHLGATATVAYFSVSDATNDGHASRLLAWRSHVPAIKLRRGTATADEWAAVTAALGEFATSGLLLCDDVRSIEELSAWARRLKAERTLRVVVVDYLQQLAPRTRGRSREEEVAGLSVALKRLAHDLDIAVVALSQLGRAPDDRRDKRPHLSDLRESGALEQDADVAILLFREEMHRPTDANAGIAEAIIAKQREGPTGVTRLFFDKALARFTNLETQQTEF